MFLKHAVLAATLMATLAQSGIAHAEEYYKPDPAKLAALEAKRCSGLYREGRLIRTRLAGGVNHSYDVEKMKKRLTEVDNDYGQYCLNWQPPVTPKPTARPRGKH
ncbi:hypothetical protein IGB42_03739 [Andreprevotia sp. IGB-42]|uniref:hypothetical protein n=1 Tax=Andreprevotia sp. IGB-42 TaxID=2497473 RepID=UPI001356A494|nr:hypothetical protein [Andreprevotia sp. IGB-42]KAF0811722.1 hypothetical protein IGB42_03739 [Andreprevotia sp. IGB-42]